MRLPAFSLAFFLLLSLTWAGQAQAAGSGSRGFPVGPEKEKRVALVMGNGAYRNARHLRNPTNDAKAMARLLDRLGFEVIHGQDLTKLEMERAIGSFGRAFTKSGVGLVYYSGHGIQVNGRNFLIPIDALLEYLEDIDLEALDLDLILARLRRAQSRLNIIVLDACRDNPFGPDSRSWTTKGLAPVQAPMGTLISFSTAAGETAADGEGEYSPYTASLLTHLQTPGLKIEEVFKRIREEVYYKTNKRQMAWVSSSVMGDFYLTPAKAGENPPAPAPKAKPRPVALAKPTLGQVEVTSNVDGVEVELAGGRYTTRAEQAVVIGQVMPGQHQVRAFKEGFQGWQGRVTVTPNQTTSLRINMDPKEELPKSFTNSIGMKFIKIPDMDLYLGIYEVTQAQWKALMGSNPSKFKSDDHPVESVSWYDIHKFIEILNGMEGKDKYRLPTEKEWEHACRAGSTDKWCFGDDESQLKNYAWYVLNSDDSTHPVGLKRPNPWHLNDMHGNVAELCLDDWGYREINRGGSWCSLINRTQCSRYGMTPKYSKYPFIGFRLVSTSEP